MSEIFQIVGGIVVVVVYTLSALSRRFPHVVWLRRFQIPWLRPTAEQQSRMRHQAAVYAGAQLILLGLVLPVGYVVLTVMMFNTPTRGTMTLVLAGSVLCIVLGITAIVQGSRR